ncbi:hypothetical protein H0N99_00355 [Candidatus Micrarchaeota archaeon]|nr:hypothetical protein [Candidatus Micrarchaeota archaeon]
MRRDQFLTCILLAGFLLGAARAITTTAVINITNPSGVVVVNNAAMSCSFVSYQVPFSTEANVCGSDSSTAANRTNYSCTYTYNKNNSVAGDWNATVKFTESGTNAKDSTITTVADAAAVSPQVAYDCTSPTACATDPACASNGSLETVTGILYTIAATQLTQSASPASPQNYGTSVTFSCNYSKTSDNSPVTGATVYVNINSINYATAYSGGNYTYTNSTLAVGSNSWYCNATEPSSLPQTGSTQTYTINTAPTALSQSASPASPKNYGTSVTFSCNYSKTSDNSPVTGATVYVNINSVNYATAYSGGNYTYTNSTLPMGNSSWYCNASATNYQSQTGSTQTYVINIQTALGQYAYPISPGIYGVSVTFYCNYSQTSNNASVTSATVYVNINSTNYAAIYNATSGNYTYATSSLPMGNSSWYCDASMSCYQSQTGSTQTYTISTPTINTSASNYSNCGAVFYRISLYDVRSKLIDSSVSVSFIDPNSNTYSSTPSRNVTGVYLGSYNLTANSTLGTWLLKVVESSGITTGKNFFVVNSS